MHLTLHLTRACNLRCSYCYAPPQADAGMSFDTGCNALRFGAELTDGSCGIAFFGGEPLLHKALIRDMIAEARAMQRRGEGQFHFKLTTNGFLLDEAFLQFALDEDILIAMSCDGVRERTTATAAFPTARQVSIGCCQSCGCCFPPGLTPAC